MFLSHYGFKESPFGVTPDPRYLYASETHREALAALLYGIQSGLGFMTLTALPGMGKTTLLFEVLNTIRNKAVTAFLFQPVSTPVELMRALLTELGISYPQGGLIELQMQLNELLIKHFKEGKRFVVVIDEAQNMNDAVLEQVRMLSNLETSREKLMQIILAGQPQLAARLASPELLQLRQRISIAARLEPLSQTETATYIRHRLTFAGYREDENLFSSSAVAMIAQHSEGIPRNINNLCFNALALGCALKQTTIGSDVLREVIADLDLKPLAAGKRNNIDIYERPPLATFTDTPERPPLATFAAPLSTFGGDIDEPEQSNWILKTVPILCVLVLVFAFVYVRFLRPYRGGLHFELPVKIASLQPSSPNTAAPGTPETRAASELPAAPDTSATPEAPPPETPEAGASDAPDVPTKVIPMRSVRVRRGQTMYTICSETYRDCKPEVFRAFLEANPGLSNPNRLVPGQKVFLPPSPPPSSRETRH